MRNKLKVPENPASDLSAWLNQVYELNKQNIDSHVEAFNKSPDIVRPVKGKLHFFDEMMTMVGGDDEIGGISREDALDLYANSRVFKSIDELRVDNAEAVLRKNKDLTGRIAALNGVAPKQVDWSKLVPTGDNNVYRLGAALISFKNSPFEISVVEY